jgi:AcrR family transcriptional regulator
LYWPSKEDLIVGLFAREALSLLDALIERLAAEPSTALPQHLAPMLLTTSRKVTIADRLTAGDFELLRQLAGQSGARELFAEVMPRALCDAVMPALHRHGLLRDDRPLADQSYAMHALLSGFGTAMSEPAGAPRSQGEPDQVLADVAARLFAPQKAPSDSAIATAAEEVIAVMNGTRAAVLDLIERTQTSGA